MAVRTFRVRIVRDGFEFEAEGDKTFVLEMLKRHTSSQKEEVFEDFKGKGQSKRTPPPPPGELLPTSKKTLSIREFIQKLEFRKHTDITLAFVYYLEKHSGVKEFSPADINKCYYEAKLESSNTSQMITQNIKSGRMMQAPGKGKKGKLYTLTQTGETFISTKLSSKS